MIMDGSTGEAVFQFFNVTKCNPNKFDWPAGSKDISDYYCADVNSIDIYG